MEIFIAYATTEGHTRKVVDFMAERIDALGYYAERVDLSGSEPQTVPGTYDKIIVAGSVHQKRHQNEVAAFVIASREALRKRPSLFVSVSLSAAFEEGLQEAQRYVDNFTEYLEWSPTATALVAGALQYDEYDFFKSQIIEHVVLKGRSVDNPKDDHDFTDWAKLAEAVETFVRA